MRKGLLFAIPVFAFGVGMSWFLFFNVPNASLLSDRVEVKVNNQTIIAEVVETNEEKELGLGGRTELGADEGMLFLFAEPGSYVFWMKGMKIPIDIVWISGTTVVGFEEDVPPPRNVSASDGELAVYFPPSSVDKVLELHAGRAATLDLQIGDALSIAPLPR